MLDMKTEEMESFETIARRESRKERRTAVSGGPGGNKIKENLV